MKTLFFILISVLLSMSQPAAARIGETRDELVKRYGQPTEDSGTQLAFLKGKVRVEAILWEGKCHLILFTPTNELDGFPKIGRLPGEPETEPEPEKPAAFTPGEIAKLLAANQGADPWKVKSDERERESADRTATATPDLIVVQTKAYTAHLEAKAADEKARKAADDALEGF